MPVAPAKLQVGEDLQFCFLPNGVWKGSLIVSPCDLEPTFCREEGNTLGEAPPPPKDLLRTNRHMDIHLVQNT